MARVVIDPGHGGNQDIGGSSWNNAVGPGGTLEKNLTLDVGLRVRDFFATTQHDVAMTRDTDINLSLIDRARVARDSSADVFVSIHFNGWPTPDVQGTETFWHVLASRSCEQLATSIQRRVLVTTGYRDRGVKTENFGAIDPANHAARTAACLVEISFITDPGEEARLGDTDYRSSLAEAIYSGIEEYLSNS